ncbi:hypothetical protein [Nonomuraea sp. NPDC049480]|uniref:hypothetical protein n=1 Tax=Nonomuraea sp. NPDC049480 TaxID=3364353 RepID=UPI0037BCAE94
MSDEQTRTEMGNSTPSEYVDAFFRFYHNGTLDESQIHPDLQEVTGRPARTFEQWARSHIENLR